MVAPKDKGGAKGGTAKNTKPGEKEKAVDETVFN